MRPTPRLALVVTLLAGALTGCAANENQARPVWISVERGNEAFADGDYALAQTFFRDAVDTYPGEPDARIGLAKTQLELGDAASARENMEMAFAARPQSDEVIDLLARTMVASGDAPAVIALLEPRTRESTDWADWHRYGKYIAMAGDADTGEAALLKAAQLSQGGQIEPHLDLGNLYASIGDADAALDRYRMALWVDFRDERAQEAIRGLGQIPGPSFALTPPEAPAQSEQPAEPAA